MNNLLQNMIFLPFILSILFGLCNSMHSAGRGTGLHENSVHTHTASDQRISLEGDALHPHSKYYHVKSVTGMINIMFDGVMIAETHSAKVLEYQSFYPEYFIPANDVVMDKLMMVEMDDTDVYGGTIKYFNVMKQGSERMAMRAARKYVVMPNHPLHILNGYFSFNAKMMDSIMINGRSVICPMSRNKMFGWKYIMKRRIIEPKLAMDMNMYSMEGEVVNDMRRLKCLFNGKIVIDSVKSKVLLMRNMMPFYFVPMGDLMKSEHIMWQKSMMNESEMMDGMDTEVMMDGMDTEVMMDGMDTEVMMDEMDNMGETENPMMMDMMGMMGDMMFYDLMVGEMTMERAVWMTTKKGLKNFRGIDLSKMDMCYLGGDLIMPHDMTMGWNIHHKYMMFKNKYQHMQLASFMDIELMGMSSLMMEFQHKCAAIMEMIVPSNPDMSGAEPLPLSTTRSRRVAPMHREKRHPMTKNSHTGHTHPHHTTTDIEEEGDTDVMSMGMGMDNDGMEPRMLSKDNLEDMEDYDNMDMDM